MDDKDKREQPARRYPRFYERLVPIALAIIGLAVLVLSLIIVGVALGLLPGGR